MRADLSKRLVPDELWELVAPLLPSFAARPQGGGTAPRDERAVFRAVAYTLTSECARRYLLESSGVSPATAHRRFSVWTEAGLWRRLHRAVLDELGARGELDWSSSLRPHEALQDPPRLPATRQRPPLRRPSRRHTPQPRPGRMIHKGTEPGFTCPAPDFCNTLPAESQARTGSAPGGHGYDHLCGQKNSRGVHRALPGTPT